jgi:hypothetical protein
MLPRTELGNLHSRVALAEEMAREGRLADGYDCLLAGLRHAMRAVKRGEPWARELYLRFLAARDAYVDRYGVTVAPTDFCPLTSRAGSPLPPDRDSCPNGRCGGRPGPPIKKARQS